MARNSWHCCSTGYFGAGERIVGILDRGATDAPKRTRSRMHTGEECQADATERAKLFNFVRLLPKKS
jgi:hypothetical protein